MKKMIVLMTLILLVNLSVSPAAAEFKKTKIAVLDFQMQGKKYQNTDMGAIVAEWLITALVKEGRFDVVERRLLKKVLSEHQLTMSGVVDDSTISELGKILGVKVIISGAVLHFQNIIEANARIINVTSGSIIAAESVKSSSAVGLEDLVIQMSAKIIKDFPLEGYVVSRQGEKVRIDLGRGAGVKEGMRFIVFKEGEVIKHPKTGEVLDVEIIETGRVQITMVRDKLAQADIIEESDLGPIEYGQMVKSVTQLARPIGKYSTEPVVSGAHGELAELDPLIEDVRQLKKSNDPQWKTNYKMLFQKLEPIYAKDPTSPEIFFYYARACEAGGDIRKANKYIKKAVYYNPNFFEAHEFQGDFNYQFGISTPKKRSKMKLAVIAQNAYESAATANPEAAYKAMMYFRIGKVHQDLTGNTAMADQYMQKAVETAPGSKAAKLAGGQ